MVYTLEVDVQLLRAIETIGPHAVTSRRESGARWERVVAALAEHVIPTIQTVEIQPAMLARGGANACTSSPPASDRDNGHANVNDCDGDDNGDNDDEPVNADGVCFDFSDITSVNGNNGLDNTNFSSANSSSETSKLLASTTAQSVRTRLRNLTSRWLYCVANNLQFSMPKQAQTADYFTSASSLIQERDCLLAAIVKERQIEQASDTKKAIAEEAFLIASLPLAAQVAAAKSAKIEACLPENSSFKLTFRTRYTVAQRLEAVARAKDIGINKAAKEFGINKSLISRWIRSAELWDASEMGAATKPSVAGINNTLLSSPLLSISTSSVCSKKFCGTAVSLLKKRVAKKPSLSTAISNDQNDGNHADHKHQLTPCLAFNMFDNTSHENSFLIENNHDIYSSENFRKRSFRQKNTQQLNKRSRPKEVEQLMTLVPVKSMPTTIITPPIDSITNAETSNICVTDELIFQNNTTVCENCDLKEDKTNSIHYSRYPYERRCSCVINNIVYPNNDCSTLVDWSAVVSARVHVVAAAAIASISMNGDISIGGTGEESVVESCSGSSCATLSQRSETCSGRSSQKNSPMVSMNNVMVSGRGSDVFEKNTSAIMHGSHGSPLQYQLHIKSAATATATENLQLLGYEANSNLAAKVNAISTDSITGRQLDSIMDEEGYIFDDVILELEDEWQEAEKKTDADNVDGVGENNVQSPQSLSQELDRSVCASMMFPMLTLSDINSNSMWQSMQGTIDDVVSGNYEVGVETSLFQLLE
ncbi:hypothetical protein HK100_001930 [Physocladia obscura]|uniref:Uncharacterized protein n=1 Tax=Physocladia obscura TaxID=109957 RepID=A0AAD5SW41_9FUNG|nr:hypothetical protein HK100_001930 [Physocladia obscura]